MRRSVATFLLAATTLSCSSSTEPAGSLAFAVTLDRALAAPGEPVHIIVTATNPTAVPISLGTDCMPVGFRVVNASGRTVGPVANWAASFVCLAVITNHILAPGAHSSFDFLWSPVENYGAAGLPVPLPPGSYAILGGLRAGEALSPVSDAVAFEVIAP